MFAELASCANGEAIGNGGSPRELLDRIRATIEAAAIREAKSSLDGQMELIGALEAVTATRSMESSNHTQRVGLVSEQLALLAGCDAESALSIRHAARLHDIGKAFIPRDILFKRGAHTLQESLVMRTHAGIGQHILEGVPFALLKLAAIIAGGHHEDWDGSGYPDGLAGTGIPFPARVVALADVLDALGSKRCYKHAWSSDRILEYVLGQRGRKFEPLHVDLLVAHWSQVEAVRHRLPD